MRLDPPPAFLPHLAYDSVIFGYSDLKLKILVMEYHRTNWFALPGGFVGVDEPLDRAVRRGLYERTGLKDIFLRQFQTFGSLERHDPAAMRQIIERSGYSVDDYGWMLDRFVSIGYYALIDFRSVHLRPDALSDSIGWYDIDRLPPLLFDHAKMVEQALATLRQNLEANLVGKNLLPGRFTMKELQLVYEAILGEPLPRSSFQRKMLASGHLRRHEKLQEGKAHKAPYLYSFTGESDS
ncbi:ADP-ribose pyrophosphatase YjhB (NUDIX family) [Neolewinella xylanilytica]|uniref:ADP-ribose pyrophosphatase YjhB (NUDIX family) n=1 Tax=Neolewinella xylanilytica TaxID=1514080 RepID=A0A2S6I4N1_9BACT|nr:NUDIX hydrolase [Neolewinella xylanilytica]PPK86143.1 ADP-ribose pyrophosphatase YjhB (NUDIX family) [Neolewinella xylanilytica]